VIDDAHIAATTTYSSNKIVSLLDALKTEILGGADAAYDTLVEIQQLLQNGTSGLDALLAAVNNRVRFDAAQSLTVAEQLQARSNIGAVAATDVGNTDTDFVAVFVGALV
jgi:capsid protein